MSSNNSKGLKEFARLVPRLTQSESDDLLLYLKTILAARRANRGKVKPPSADQWERLSYLAKWKLYLHILWWSTLADLNRKISQARIR